MPKKFTKPKFQRVRIQRWVSLLRIGLVVIHILLGSLFYLLLATFNSKVKKLGYLSSKYNLWTVNIEPQKVVLSLAHFMASPSSSSLDVDGKTINH